MATRILRGLYKSLSQWSTGVWTFAVERKGSFWMCKTIGLR